MSSDHECPQTYYEGSGGNSAGPRVIRVVVIDENGMEETSRLREPRHHSPDGFQWGYGGSGPADAALAILTHALGYEPLPAMYQHFKFDHVATWGDSFSISRTEVLAWAESWRAHENG